ncbi:MAG: hypothetical protein WCA77_02645 [Thermoplasmata archaeon]
MTAAGRSTDTVETDDPCILPGCSESAVRHLTLTEAKRAFEDLPDQGRRAPLCRAHYKAWKQATKGDRRIERLGH